MISVLSLLIATLLVVPGSALAQTTDPAPTVTDPPAVTTDLTTTAPIDETAFDLPAPSGWEFFKRRFVRFFTFGEVKRLRQELELANLTLLATQDENTTGDTERAATLLDQFTAEIERISGRVGDLAADLATRTDDAQVQSLLETIQTDRLLQASATEQLSATTQAELQSKALQARTTALRDLAKLLSADDPTPAKFQERLAKIAAKLAQREAKLERKIAKRLATLEALDEEIEDPELEDAIQAEATDELDDITALDKEKLGLVVRQIEGTLAKHLLVLQSLLDRLPEASRDTVETVLKQGIERLKQDLETDQTALDDLFDEDHESDLQEKLLERLGKETEKAAEDVKETVEKQREQTKKALERERERAKQAAEDDRDEDADQFDDGETEDADSDEGKDDDDEQPASGSGAGSTGASKQESSPSTGSGSSEKANGGNTGGSGSSGNTGSGGSSESNQGSGGSQDNGDKEKDDEVKTESKEIEVKDSQFKTTSIEVEKGTQLTVTLKNKDSLAHTFSIVGTSTSTGTVAAGQEKSVTFTVDQDLEFYCALHSSMAHGTIKVKN